MTELLRGVTYKADDVKYLNSNFYEETTQRKGEDYIRYYELPASYDIETSSFRDDQDSQVAIVYAHILNIDGYVFKWETWNDTIIAFNHLKEVFGLSYYRRIIVFAHNLSYEFQFLKKRFEFTNVFNNGGERKVLKAEMKIGLEFRCSLMLSGSSLAGVAKNLTNYTIRKLEGDLDYSKIRTPETKITDKELQYMIHDVVIVEYYIRECMKESGGITKIPLTNTGRVRKYTADMTIKNEDPKVAKEYKKLMSDLVLGVEEYKGLRHAFAGGFTHANVKNVKRTHENVTARDFASSYPARMIAYQFPMSKGEQYPVRNKEDFWKQLDSYCCLFYVKLKGLTRIANEGYLSYSKALRSEHVTVNNGRVESAVSLELWMTDVDFKSVILSYDVDDFEVFRLFRYKRGYLPKAFIESIIHLYEMKTELKGVKGKEADYKMSKALLNSLYGMSVQEIVQDEFEWDDIHKTIIKEPADIALKLAKTNDSYKRFLYYPWGVWITAYARYDLFRDVVKLGDDYIYCDTDSIYYKNAEKHEEIFKESNERIKKQLQAAADHHGIDVLRLSPKDPEGVRHTIGLWDLDGVYKKFKTLGAKRYIVEDEDGKVNITVSGINKSSAVPYLLEQYGDNVFEAFDEHLHVPEGACGKSTHTYIDGAKAGVVTDYLGGIYEYEEYSGIHLEETSYTMTISNEYSEMIDYMQNERPLSK